MTTALVINTDHSIHDEPRHVERAERLQAILEALEDSNLLDDVLSIPTLPASDKDILAVHSIHQFETIRMASMHEHMWLDQDTYTTGGTLHAARMSVGAVIQAVDAVLTRRAQNAFALTRPPGHHATPNRSMGFCMFNNVAIAARYALEELSLSRVAIIDYDVHHGNGTQDCFYDDDRVLFCSTHGAPLYPGTGHPSEIGQGRGRGLTLNMALPYGTGDMGFSMLYDTLIIPALRQFAPELVIVSAGYDGHWMDPIGPLALSTSGYTSLTRRLLDFAEAHCNGNIVLALEGGYDEDALAACTLSSLAVLMGLPEPEDHLGSYGNAEPNIQVLIDSLLRNHPLFIRTV